MAILMTNYDAALANCRRVELATYQSLTNDPQFIFPKIPAGSYEMRCTITLKDLQHLETSWQIRLPEQRGARGSRVLRFVKDL